MTKFKKYKWRLYADNNIEQDIVEHLRKFGMDVLWVAENFDLRKQQDDTFHYRRAYKLSRYLLTKDMDFWDDQKHPLNNSPGVIIINTNESTIAKYLPIMLRKIIHDYNPLSEPLYLRGVKVKLNFEGFTLKMLDHNIQKVTIESWNWKELM